jgi:glycosyltransferase involved in cell wall biosynthesis
MTRALKVMMLVESLTIGGLPNYVLETCRALRAAGHTPVLAHGPGTPPSHLECQGVELLPLASGPSWDVPEALGRIRDWGPDLIHAHLCSHLPLLQALPSLGLPLLRTFHDYTSLCLRMGRRRFPGDRCHRPLGWSCVMFGCAIGSPRPGSRLPHVADVPAKLSEVELYRSQFDHALVGSQHMRRILLINGFDAGRVSVVPYASRFDAQATGRVPLAPKPAGTPGVDRPLQFLFAGQAVAGKGLMVLVRALSQLQGDWLLTAVTTGPQLPKVKALVARHGLGDRIRFIDWLTQAALGELYRQSDVFVVPSVWDDPGPLVGIESLSLETPVVAFPVGGLPDYVLDGQTGWLAREVSVKALTRGLHEAMLAGPQLPVIGQRGRAHVAAHHSQQQHIDHLIRIYQEALGLRPRPAQAHTSIVSTASMSMQEVSP